MHSILSSNINIKSLFVPFLLITYYFFLIPLSAAQTLTCTPVYGGGRFNCSQAQQLQQRQQEQQQIIQNQTKGGLPVYPTPQVSTTPATGPEMVGLVGLLFSGLGGLLLRKRVYV